MLWYPLTKKVPIQKLTVMSIIHNDKIQKAFAETVKRNRCSILSPWCVLTLAAKMDCGSCLLFTLCACKSQVQWSSFWAKQCSELFYDPIRFCKEIKNGESETYVTNVSSVGSIIGHMNIPYINLKINDKLK